MSKYQVLTSGGLRPLTPDRLHKRGAAYEGKNKRREQYS